VFAHWARGERISHVCGGSADLLGLARGCVCGEGNDAEAWGREFRYGGAEQGKGTAMSDDGGGNM
jgi:hypothetical protein